MPYLPSGVYPRVYGGTGIGRLGIGHPAGLSPRVRGNPDADADLPRRMRSIPACTGEPRLWGMNQTAGGVYPRVYGGTPRHIGSHKERAGLSPRVRGNLARRCPTCRLRRSIPACTGEPRCRLEPGTDAAVYPRVYGGTKAGKQARENLEGLSPRVRGNHKHVEGV